MAEACGVPRGNYDGPVHDVISMTKSVPPTPTNRGPPCPKTQTGSRNLHQSGFTLAGSVHTCRTHIHTHLQYSDWIGPDSTASTQPIHIIRTAKKNINTYNKHTVNVIRIRSQLTVKAVRCSLEEEFTLWYLFLLGLSRCSGWWPHTSPLHSEDCGATWWTVQHYILILKQEESNCQFEFVPPLLQHTSKPDYFLTTSTTSYNCSTLSTTEPCYNLTRPSTVVFELEPDSQTQSTSINTKSYYNPKAYIKPFYNTTNPVTEILKLYLSSTEPNLNLTNPVIAQLVLNPPT